MSVTTAHPKAAIIIPHFNDIPRLQRCLAALAPQLIPATELVVIDNGSTASLDPVRSAHPGLRIVTEPRKSAANARNRGVAETTAPLLFFLDCDCIPASDWLAMALRMAHQADLTGGAVEVFDEGADQVSPALPGHSRSGAQAFEAVFAFHNRDYVQTKGFSVTANLLTRRDVFLATGPFVAGLSEDLDWCHRARAKGYTIAYAAELVVQHPSRRDWAALRHKWQRLMQEAYAVNGSGPLARARWVLKALAMPVSILAHAPRVLRSPQLTGWRERQGALRTLARIRLQRAIWMLRQAAGGAM